MPEPKRKFEAEVVAVSTLRLEPVSAKTKKINAQKSLRKREKEFGFTHELIFGIIERIKDL